MFVPFRNDLPKKIPMLYLAHQHAIEIMKKKPKQIVRIALYVCGLIVAVALIPVIIFAYLYVTADFKKPVGFEPADMQVARIGDSLRAYGSDTLRLSRSGLWEMRIGGGAFERGVAYGKLAQDILYRQEQIFVDQIRTFVPSESYLKFLRYMTLMFNHSLGKYIGEEYRQEIYGISLSCSDDFNFVCEPYERQMNYHSAHDIGHAMQDYMLVGCSSFAAWDTCSATGDLMVGRNFDFYIGDDFARNRIVMFCFPTNGYRFASVSWPGMIGVMSGMNEKGLTVTINAAKSAIPTSSATPISILTREILQYASTIDEAYAIARRRKTFVSESILIGSAADSCAAVIEKSPDKIALRTADSAFIISTNHYQSAAFADDDRNIENIATSDSPYRYKRIDQLLHRKMPLNADGAVSILRDYKGLNDSIIGWTNEAALNQFIGHHSVVFNANRLIMWVSTSPWQAGPYVAYDLAAIFNGATGFSGEVADRQLTIPADQTIPADDIFRIKRLTREFKAAIAQAQTIDSTELAEFEQLNPELFATHEILGDYHFAQSDTATARRYWKTALTKMIPKQSERERIEKKISGLD